MSEPPKPPMAGMARCRWCELGTQTPCHWEEDAAPCLAEQLRTARKTIEARSSPTKGVACAFCGRTEKQVRLMVAGPTQYICDECVELCMEVIHTERDTVEGEAEYLSWFERD